MFLTTPTSLGDDQIKAILNKKASNLVSRGRFYESHLKIYTEPLDESELSNEIAWRQLKALKDGRLIEEKRKATDKFFTFPLPVVKECSDALRSLYRVFDARNASFSNEYPTDRAKALGEQMLSRLKVNSYIEKTAKQVLKNKPNTFVVLDKDSEGRVYIVTIDNDRLIDVAFMADSTTELDYIAFYHHSEKQGDNQIDYYGFYDTASYKVFSKDQNGVFAKVVDNPHNLGACPARPFLSALRTSGNKLDRFNPFTEVRAILADFTLFKCFSLHGQYYLSFPVIEAARPACSNPDCEDGFVVTNTVLDDGEDGEEGEVRTACESCSSGAVFIGPGTISFIDPAGYNDERDASGYLRYVSPPTENIEYQDDVQLSRRQQIKEAVTGINDLMADQAVNVEQVRAVMESAKKPLSFIARQLDSLDVWLVETAHKLEFDFNMTRQANWGTEWYLLTEGQIQDLYGKAKEIGLPEAEVRELYTLLIETKYKANPDQVRVKLMELNINPAPFSSLEECYTKFQQAVMTKEDLTIKANFDRYVLRFERENGSLSQFGRAAIQQKTKTLAGIITHIYNTFISYATTDNQGQPITDTANSGDAQAGGSV